MTKRSKVAAACALAALAAAAAGAWPWSRRPKAACRDSVTYESIVQELPRLDPHKYAGILPSLALAMSCRAVAESNPEACSRAKGLDFTVTKAFDAYVSHIPLDQACRHIYLQVIVFRAMSLGRKEQAFQYCMQDKEFGNMFGPSFEKFCRYLASDPPGTGPEICKHIVRYLDRKTVGPGVETVAEWCKTVPRDAGWHGLASKTKGDLCSLVYDSQDNVPAAGRARPGGDASKCGANATCRALYLQSGRECEPRDRALVDGYCSVLEGGG
jgi:hypothetical protein